MTNSANTYARALYDLAAEEALEAVILQQMQTLQTAFAAEPDFLRLLANPALSKDTRCGILDDSFRGKLQPYVLNFLKILTEKGYILHFGDCCDGYRALYQQAHNILPVTATTAVPLSPAQEARLTEKLHTITGKTIELANHVDAAVLGGMRLDFDGKRLDDTIAHRMDALRAMLQETVL